MEKRFKFKSLNTFASNEWMANSAKRYRSCFDKEEVDYVRCELAIYNKLFDEEDWTAKLTLKAVDEKGTKEHCSLEEEIKVSKDENIFYFRDGWGNADAGTYWTKGTYKWQAFIDGVLIGEKFFHINEVGKVTNNHNPYFVMEHIKLYEGDINGWQQRNRKYLKTFNKKTTRYIWTEIKFKNITPLDYHYEFYLNYFDDAGQPKATIVHSAYMGDNRQDFSYYIERGWGTEEGGTWMDDKYTLEVVFNDVMVGAVTFNCADADEEGELELIKTIEQTLAIGNSGSPVKQKITDEGDQKTLDELLSELDGLIGLESVKKSIRENITYLNFTKMRREKGFEDTDKISLHSIFTGNPGTGKTTVVKMLGKIYHKMGLLSKGHVVEVDRASLVGEFIGQTAPKTKKAIESARGGILFIDEAYSLARGDDDSKDFGKEVIEALLKEMSDGPGDIAIIGAGYPKQMKTFIESNPGLKSRFTQYFHFDDYLPEELFDIAIYAAKNKQVSFSNDATEYLKEQLTEAYRRRDESFGNARFVNAVVDESKMNMGLRLMIVPDAASLSNDELSTVTLDDLRSVFLSEQKKKLKLSINEKELQAALNELHELTGLDKVKEDVNEMVKLIRFYNETGKDVVNKFSLHSVFTGNPGTGKTTVARIMAKIYKALGVLERGHCVEVDREGLVASYVGQTATKTAAKVEEAMGGILFIDEAYALASQASGNDFGQEAIQVILKRMEDQRGKFGVIVAGYPENMHQFIESNPGFKSRFDKTFLFEDYAPEQLITIAMHLLHKEGLKPSDSAREHMMKHLTSLYESRDKHFGNARAVRQMAGDVIKRQNLRLAGMEASKRSEEELSTLSFEDVKHLDIQPSQQKQTLGFRLGGK
jgi:SpoVK/Ycf46/Vps4 family AAA+-type ATPase